MWQAHVVCRNSASLDLLGLVHNIILILKSTIVMIHVRFYLALLKCQQNLAVALCVLKKIEVSNSGSISSEHHCQPSGSLVDFCRATPSVNLVGCNRLPRLFDQLIGLFFTFYVSRFTSRGQAMGLTAAQKFQSLSRAIALRISVNRVDLINVV